MTPRSCILRLNTCDSLYPSKPYQHFLLGLLLLIANQVRIHQLWHMRPSQNLIPPMEYPLFPTKVEN
ncbi:hypothetical protein L1887_14718 [Cichorium endivia]|nr:hypothetical protein L1887_14718 [Cichorium endivia]